MKPARLLLALAAMFSFLSASADPLAVGAAAPAVSALTHEGQKLNLGDVYPKGFTLVYFYPKADTPGCTAQGCSLRDAYAELGAKGVTVIGVSTDGVEAQRKFREKHNLPFTLLADTEKAVVTGFGVPTTMGFASRQAFLVDKTGKVVWADHKASTKKQAEDVLNALKTLGG
jgi:peroxiredoxin Q/BCP